ncbi:hypothetical protein FRAHR75_240034 [Frankia sp. Hr75.2]|nr:hypothetical protein FRAHR75_240034 [Frankia sp. Hr75.2]
MIDHSAFHPSDGSPDVLTPAPAALRQAVTQSDGAGPPDRPVNVGREPGTGSSGRASQDLALCTGRPTRTGSVA